MKTVELGVVSSFIRGITFKPADVLDEPSPDSIPVMRTKNVQTELDLSDVIEIPRHLAGRPDQRLQAGDVLISSANSWNLVGKCCWVPELDRPASIGGFVTALRANCSQIDPRYLYRWFAAPRTQAMVRNTANQTTNIANLNLKRCEQLHVPLPPLSEQRRIAAILDQADTLRTKRRQALAHLDKLGQSVFQEVFGGVDWPVSSLADVVRRGTIVTYGIVQAGPEVEHGVPYIRTGDLVDGRIAVPGLRRTSPEIAARFDRSRVETGDIVMSIRATVGTTAFVPAAIDGANLTQGTARIAPGEQTVGEYLLEFLRSHATQRWIQAQVKGATFREITLGRLRELPVNLPPLDLQHEFADRMKQVRAQRSNLLSALTVSDKLFASLQSRAFHGEH